MKELRINERFEFACPELSSDEYDRLEALIIKDGIIFSPVLIWNNVIIDGHNRYQIAKKNGIEFTTQELSFESDDDAIAWIKENAIGQRNLNNYQRSKLVLELEDYYKAKAKERMQAGKKIDPVPILAQGKVREQLAEKAGVSHGTIDKVKKIEAKAKPEIKNKLREGKISITKAFTEIEENEQSMERDPEVKIIREGKIRVEKLEMYFKSKTLLKEFSAILFDLADLISGKLICYESGMKSEYPGIHKEPSPKKSAKDVIATDVEFEETDFKNVKETTLEQMKDMFDRHFKYVPDDPETPLRKKRYSDLYDYVSQLPLKHRLFELLNEPDPNSLEKVKPLRIETRTAENCWSDFVFRIEREPEEYIEDEMIYDLERGRF